MQVPWRDFVRVLRTLGYAEQKSKALKIRGRRARIFLELNEYLAQAECLLTSL
jgi:hypothetical protein